MSMEQKDLSVMVEEYYELIEEIEKLKNRLYNRELALDYVRQINPGLWGAMTDEFIGLPVQGEGGEYEPKYVRG